MKADAEPIHLDRLNSIADLIRQNGRGLVEANLKLRRLLESRPEAPPPAPDRDQDFELLADLVEGLDRAIGECRRAPARAEGVAVGLEVLRRRILEALAARGILPVKAEGAFRSQAHRVVSTVPGAPPGRIVSVVRRGWARRSEGRVALVRPALVVVGAMPEAGKI